MQTKPSALTGILLLVAGFQIVPFMDAIGKYLSQEGYSIWQISWARFFFHFFFLAPAVIWRYRGAVFRLPMQWLQILRGGFLMCATYLFFYSVSLLPLADTLAITFVGPFIVTILSSLVLKEKVGWRRRAAVAVGFCGALVIVRPGFEVVGWGTISALACACIFACYVIATKKLAGSAPPIVTLTYTALLGNVVFSIVMLTGGEAVWKTPDLEGWALMAGIGVFAVAGHYLVIKAYDYADASLLAPFGYTEMTMTATLGYVFFNDFPDLWTWVGLAIIVASGVYISLRERQLAKAQA